MPTPPPPVRRHCEAFTPVQQTLIIPLVARALGGGLYPGHACGDEQASRLLRTLEIDGQAYLADRPTVLNVLWRTRLIRECAQAFFVEHPKAWGINLGCGLTDYFQWLNNGQNTWLDADLAEVMALRKTLLPAQMPRLRAGTADLQQPGWWQRLRLPKRATAQPVLLLIEGVLLYFQPDEVRAVLQEFAEAAPAGSVLVLDTMARCAVGQAQWHASVGRTQAQFRWGIGQMQELTACHPRLQLRQSHSVAPSHGWMGVAMEAMWNPWGHSAPLYGLAELVLDTMARCAVGQAQWHASVGRTQAQFRWGIGQMQELTACHPRLQLRQSHSVAPSHGWMGVAMEAMWNPWGHSAPLYGLAELVLE